MLQKHYAKCPFTYEAILKKYRNTLTSLIRAAKRNNYKSKLTERAGSTKNLGNYKQYYGEKSASALPNSIIFQEKTTSRNQELAESFTYYFFSIANKLTQGVQQSSTPFSNYLPEPVTFSFFIQPTSSGETETD